MTETFPPQQLRTPVETLRAELAQCLAWFGTTDVPPPKENGGSDFRRLALADAARQVFPDSCHSRYSESTTAAMAEFQRRRAATAPTWRGGVDLRSLVERELYRPRSILVLDWSTSLFDGAMGPLSREFIDFDGMPAWDAWIGLHSIQRPYADVCLLSWIPPSLESMIADAISVDAAQSYAWLDVPRDEVATARWRN